MKKLNEPTIHFNIERPSYAEITKIIMKIKLSASSCPNDAISIIAFKKCPILRSHLVKIIQTDWTEKTFPKIWRSGVTVLAHKKDHSGKPENFRPIALQPVLSKLFTSLIRNRLYTLAADNGYIETNVQKGFWKKIYGCVEHIETLTHMINNARIKQQDCVLTLLDLENDFGEVNRNLLVETLKIHHVPDDIITLITSLYTDYTTSIITDTFMTSSIKVQIEFYKRTACHLYCLI